MRTGRGCAEFLAWNFGVVDFIEELQRSAHPVMHDANKRQSGRHGAVYEARLNGLRKAGKLTMEEGFRAVAWGYGKTLYPGFLTDDQRCTGVGEGPKP